MKRKEEINQAAHQKYPYEGGTLGMICERSIPIFIQGAEWADRTMIDKAIKWMEENLSVCKGSEAPYILARFRKAMEE